MWFEIIPSALIIYGAFNLATIGTYAIHSSFLGNAYKRDLRWSYNRTTYLRDRRLMDNPYLFNGLEVIPDAPRTCDHTDPSCCCPKSKKKKK